MVTTFLEVEVKFAVDGETSVPDLTALPGVARVDDAQVHNLSAIYYDTRDLRLTRSKVTLRRRTGGKDDGWHLKLPGEQGRIELSSELTEPVGGQFRVPEDLLTLIRSIVRQRELVPIAQVDNTRTETLLRSAESPLAEFCDDRVTAWSLLPGGSSTSWREWELELAGELPGTEDGQDLIDSATTVLIGAGARKSKSPSKLVAALGDSVDSAPVPDYLSGHSENDTAAAGVVRALSANRDKLVALDPRVRRDEWDSIHQMRVATRELRSHLQTFDGVLAGERVERLLAELKELAGVLGQARDAEVVEERFLWLLDNEDSGTVTDEDRERLLGAIRREYERAHRRVVATLDSERYLQLLEDIDALLAEPPVVKQEDSSVEDVMAEHLDAAFKKLRKRHKRAVGNWDNEDLTLHEREEYFHDMRKAAKKLRYAAEAVGSATGMKTGKIYKACKKMQSVLGDFQDSVTSRDKLLALAGADRRKGNDTFVYGLLYQRERYIGLESLEEYSDAYAKIESAYRKLRK